MAVLTGANGALRFNGVAIAKVRNWSLSVSRDALDTTCLTTTDREYVPGLRGASGSCTVLYDPDERRAADLLNGIFRDESEPTDLVEFVLDTLRNARIAGKALITSISPSVSVGDAQSCDVQFQLSGKLQGGF
jgi:hypothetical protein